MKQAENVCPICGQPTYLVYGRYPRKDGLCSKCGKDLRDGLIEQCPICGKWNNTDEICECKKPKKTNNDELTCLICGKPSDGKHFCIDCWTKYNNKSFDIRITNCKTTKIIDEYGNKTKKAKDGRFVRSLHEKVILDYFFDNYIRVIYEKTIPYINEKNEDKELHPDFYLIDYDLYIEFNGIKKKAYLNRKEYCNKIYQDKGLKVEILEPKDTNDIDATMEKIFNKYQKIAR